MKADEAKYDIDRIKALIDAFYKGETSIEEEKYLLSYFENEDLALELQHEKDLFLQLYDVDPVDVPEHLESRIDGLIDCLAAEEEGEKKVIGINDKKQNSKRLWVWIGSAACIVVLVVSGFFMINKEQNKAIIASNDIALRDTYSDPKDAQAEAEKALASLSIHFNKGIDQLAMANSKIKKTNQILDKTFK